MSYFDERSERWLSEPTPIQRWVLDEESDFCHKCRLEFTPLITSRHHCRKCGKIFCYDCCRNKCLIPRHQMVMRPKSELVSNFSTDEEIFISPQRICDDCYEVLLPLQSQLRTQMSRGYQEDILNGSLISLPSINFTLEQEIERAISLLNTLGETPRQFSKEIEGAVFLTVVKAGALFSGNYGTGFVVAKLDDGWSAPSAVTLTGIGLGFQIGAEVSHMILLLPNQASVDGFKSKGQFVVGGEASIALVMGGSVEVGAGAGDEGMSLGHGIGMSQGLFVGGSFEMKVVATRNDVNQKFYGQKVTPVQLLSGEFPRPPALDSLNFTIMQCLN